MIRAKLSATTTRGWRSAAAALLLSTCLAGPVLAEESAPAAPATAETTTTPAVPAVPFSFKAEAPKVDVIEGNVTADEIQALFGDKAGDTLGKLSTITAKQISIPSITITLTVPDEAGKSVTVTSTISDVTFDDVVDGVAANVTIGKTDVSTGPEFTLTYGKMAATKLSLAGMLGVYGLIDTTSDSDEPSLVYGSFTAEGGAVTTPVVNCTIGGFESGEFLAAPLSVSFADVGAAISAADAADKAGEKPSPETLKTILTYYADLFTSFTSDPVTFKGFSCSGKDPQTGNEMTLSSGDLTISGYEPGYYPAIAINDLKADLGPLGTFSLGNFTWKQMDLNGPVETLRSAESFDEAWFAANWRKLIPAIEGLALTQLDMDVIDPEKPGERVKLQVSGFDVTLADYVNGIPSNIAVATDNLVVPVNAADPSMASLAQLGLTQVDLSFGTAFHWDEENSTIAVDNLAFNSPELGQIGLSGTIGNATADLFSEDTDAAAAASLGLTVKQLHITLEDKGIVSQLITASAKEANQPEATFKAMVSGQMQGMLLAILGSNDQAMGAAKAIGEFIDGKKQLDLTLTSVDPNGVSLAEISAASENPTLLSGKFTVEGSAQ